MGPPSALTLTVQILQNETSSFLKFLLLGPCVYVPEPSKAMQTSQVPGIYSTNTKLMNGKEALWEENQEGAFLGSWHPCHPQQPLKVLFQIPYAID